MSFKINLYNNTSAKNRIDKKLTSIRSTDNPEGDNALEGELREECSIENPSIRIRINDVSDLQHCNYMYIPIFDRYYYITDIISERNRIVTVKGHVDVLMTYKKAIRENTAIISRSSQVPSLGNTYLNDDKLATYADSYNVSYPWGYTFSHTNDSLLLAVAGASVTSTT